jgi:hypothetical protein
MLTGMLGSRKSCQFENYLAGFFERYLAQVRPRFRGGLASRAGVCPSNDR